MTGSTWYEWREHPALIEAKRALKLPTGQPTEADRPPRVSHPPEVIPGQLDLWGNVHEEAPRRMKSRRRTRRRRRERPAA
jgi:hypothetical protein